MFNKEKPYFVGNVLMCGISNINAGCSGNMGKNLEIDLDNFKYSIDVVPTVGDNRIYKELYCIGLDNNSIEKLKNLNKELNDLSKERTKRLEEGADCGNIDKKIEDKDQEIKKIKLNKFFFILERLDEKESYTISYKKTNINIKGYKKDKEGCNDFLNLFKKFNDSQYDGGSDFTSDDDTKYNEFKEKNKELFILYKVTYLEKKRKGSDKTEVVEYEEIVDIYKKL